VGCGNGAFLKTAQTLGWSVQGIEPDPAAVETARRAGLPVEQGLLVENTFAGRGEEETAFEAITLNHVLEHLHDPMRTLRLCYDLLRPGGVLWMATPNLASLGHRRYGPCWLHLDPPRHLVLFTPRSLKESLSRVGYVVSGPLRNAGGPGGADLSFNCSARIAAGQSVTGPDAAAFAAPPDVHRIARAAENVSWHRPELAEEIILAARKPLAE